MVGVFSILSVLSFCSFDCSFFSSLSRCCCCLSLVLLRLATLYICHSCFEFNNFHSCARFSSAYFKNHTCFYFPYLHKFWCIFLAFCTIFLLLNYKIQNARTKQYTHSAILQRMRTMPMPMRMRMRMHKHFNVWILIFFICCCSPGMFFFFRLLSNGLSVLFLM